MSELIDWIHPDQIEMNPKASLAHSIKGCDCEFVAAYQMDAIGYRMVIYRRRDSYIHHRIMVTSRGVALGGTQQIVRMKPAVVAIPECWLMWWPSGEYTVLRSLGSYRGAIEKGAVLVKHIPAAEIEIEPAPAEPEPDACKCREELL